MANMIGPAGKVVGTDTDQEILELAKEDAEIAKTGNVEFRQVDACLCQSHEDYDLIYARFLLSHLSEPEKCLETMVEACRPGGILSSRMSILPAAFVIRFVQLMRGIWNSIRRS